MREVFWNHICFKMGLGNDIRFWEDRWIGEIPLKVSFRSLFTLTIDHRERVVDSFDVGENIWMPRLFRDLNDWELDELYRLLSFFEGSKPNPSWVDGLDWLFLGTVE